MLHISVTNDPTGMVHVSEWSSILTEHPDSYGFKSRDMGVAQHGGISDPLEGQGLGENFWITGS